MSIREMIVSRAAGAVEHLRVRSGLNPFLWLAGIIIVPGMIMYSYRPNHMILCTISVTLAVVLFASIYLLVKHPGMLQSEEYQLKRQVLDMIQNKGDITPIDASLVRSVAEPQQYRALANLDEE